MEASMYNWYRNRESINHIEPGALWYEFDNMLILFSDDETMTADYMPGMFDVLESDPRTVEQKQRFKTLHELNKE